LENKEALKELAGSVEDFIDLSGNSYTCRRSRELTGIP
jgi:hypothetical protein